MATSSFATDAVGAPKCTNLEPLFTLSVDITINGERTIFVLLKVLWMMPGININQ